MRTSRPPSDSKVSGEVPRDPAGSAGARYGVFPSPYTILTEAIKAVPALKYALGVLGIVAAIAIVNALQVNYRVAVLGTVVTLALMVALVVFAKLTQTAPKRFVAPVLVLMWTLLLLTIATACLMFTSVFFKVPVDLQEWIKPGPRAPVEHSSVGLSAVLERHAPPLPAETARPLEFGVEVIARRAGTDTFAMLPDGAELASEVDDYLVVARPLTAGHLYVFQFDSAGRVQWLFPSNDTSSYSSGANPVRAGSTVTVPDGSGRALYLDSTLGIESVYAVFSATPWPELEAALREASRQPTPRGIRRELLSGNRGVGGVRRAPASNADRAVVTQLDGRPYRLPTPVELTYASGHFVVVKHWFTHVAPR